MFSHLRLKAEDGQLDLHYKMKKFSSSFVTSSLVTPLGRIISHVIKITPFLLYMGHKLFLCLIASPHQSKRSAWVLKCAGPMISGLIIQLLQTGCYKPVLQQKNSYHGKVWAFFPPLSLMVPYGTKFMDHLCSQLRLNFF